MNRVKYSNSTMVNICDIKLRGEKLIENGLVVELNPVFYNDEISETDVETILKNSSIINLIGNNIVNKALEMKLARKESVKTIAGVKILMIYKFMFR
ncbi:MAG: hypothetical protein DA328_01825 [Nitrososphaeraceae archaeon]|nr:hypothetical protein [Nitrososphaeraceae archaeon]